MILEGTIKRLLDVQEGVSKAGKPWKKAMYLVEGDGRYPVETAVTVFGEKNIEDFAFIAGQRVRLGVEAESREFNGKWYTSINVLANLDPEADGLVQKNSAAKQQDAPAEPVQSATQSAASDDESENLPF